MLFGCHFKMETLPTSYSAEQSRAQDEDIYQPQDIFVDQQVLFDPLFFSGDVAYSVQGSTDTLAGLPFLFGEVPYPSQFPVTAPLPQATSGIDFHPHQEYMNFNTSSFMGPWLDTIPILNSFPSAEQNQHLIESPRTPFELSPLELSPLTSKSTETDDFRAMIGSFPASESSTPVHSRRESKRKVSHSVMYSDSETQTTGSPANDSSSYSPQVSTAPKKPKPLDQRTEPPTIELPKSKKLRGLPSSLITVFDVNTTPQVKRNTRKSYSDEARKRVEDVRKIGACSQCRFRKRTCGTGWPCHSCIRRSDSVEIAATICIRDSPFEDVSATEFYGSASRTRVVDFTASFGAIEGRRSLVTIATKGNPCHTLEFRVQHVETSMLSDEIKKRIDHIAYLRSSHRPGDASEPTSPQSVAIVEPKTLSAQDLTKFAVENTCKCNRTHNVGLFMFAVDLCPQETSLCLVGDMAKLSSLHAVLAGGVRIPPETLANDIDMGIIYAQIDSVMFRCLQEFHRRIYREFQRLVFKSFGLLKREMILPVCITLFLLIRIQLQRASYMSNMRPKASKDPITDTYGASKTSASYQDHHLKHLVAPCIAVFRNSPPLFLDFDDKCNCDLVAAWLKWRNGVRGS